MLVVVFMSTCPPTREIRNASRGGNPRELGNWDTLREKLDSAYYELRVGGEGSINVSFAKGQ